MFTLRFLLQHVKAAVLLLLLSCFAIFATGFHFQSPLPEPTLLIVNHLSDLRYSFPVPDLLADTGLLATTLPTPTPNRTYRHYLLSADPLLSSIGNDEPDDNELLNELRQSQFGPNSNRGSLNRMQRAQEWSVAAHINQPESCAQGTATTVNCSQSYLPSNSITSDAALMAASPDSGLHSESNVTSEASYSSHEHADIHNANVLRYDLPDESYNSDLQSQMDFNGALVQAFHVPGYQPNQNVSVLCNSFDAMSTNCANPTQLNPQTNNSHSFAYAAASQMSNSSDFVLSDLSEFDFQMASFADSNLNQKSSNEFKENNTNNMQNGSFSPSNMYDSGSDNLSNFEDDVNSYQQQPMAAMAGFENTEPAAASALPVAQQPNSTYFECLDANNCTLNYGFNFRTYDLNDSVANFTTTPINDFVACASQNTPSTPAPSNDFSVQCNAYDNVMHNHSYTNADSAMAVDMMSTSAHAYAHSNQLSYQQAAQQAFAYQNYSALNGSRKDASSASASMDSFSVTSDSMSEDDRCISRDERKARELQIPITVADIINLPIDEFNERLSQCDLSEAQLSLIRDIRRRGKNKVAAQNCRKRKMDQIFSLQQEVDQLYSKKTMLLSYSKHLFSVRDEAHSKYQKLYDFVRHSASGSTLTSLQYNFSPLAQASQSASTSSAANRSSMFNDTLFAHQSDSSAAYLLTATNSSDSSSSSSSTSSSSVSSATSSSSSSSTSASSATASSSSAVSLSQNVFKKSIPCN